MKINIPKSKDTNVPKLRRISYSVLIAFIFWFFIKSEDDYLVTQKIPLVARNLQEQKTYKEEVPKDILVTIRGSGRSFIWLALFENFYDDYKAIIDLSSIADQYNFNLNEYYRDNPTKIVLPVSLGLQFVEVVSPKNIVINLDQYLVKKVPIQSQVFISTESGYIQVGDENFIPNSINIGGPQEIVNSIKFVKTQKDTLLNLMASIEKELSIINPNKLVDFAIKKKVNYIAVGSFYKSKLKPNAKRANIKIIKETKKKTKIPIVVIGGITNKNYKKFITLGANYIAISSLFGITHFLDQN